MTRFETALQIVDVQVARYAGSIHKFRSFYDADDLRQDVLMKIGDIIKSYDESEGVKFGSWVFSKVRWMIVDIIRVKFGRAGSYKSDYLRSPKMVVESCYNEGGDPIPRGEVIESRHFDETGFNELIEHCCLSLDPVETQIVELMARQGHNQAEAARKIGISESRVSQLVKSMRPRILASIS